MARDAQRAIDVIVVKIGGSTLGSHDTTLADVAELHSRGLRVVVVHGGGALISEWLERLDVPTSFERGLRVTDAASLDVVVAVLAGLVNKQLVAVPSGAGRSALSASPAPTGHAPLPRSRDEALGFVGEIAEGRRRPRRVISPRARYRSSRRSAAVRSDAARRPAPQRQRRHRRRRHRRGARRELARLHDRRPRREVGRPRRAVAQRREARELIESGVIAGGMIPKVEACLRAAAAGAEPSSSTAEQSTRSSPHRRQRNGTEHGTLSE